MKDQKRTNKALEPFVPSYSISLLYKKENSIALRVFISDKKNKYDAIQEATSLYRWKMNNYELIQSVAAKLDCVSATIL